VHSGGNNILWCDGHVSRWDDVNLLVKEPYRTTNSEDKWTAGFNPSQP